MIMTVRDYLYFFYNNPKKKAAWIIKGEDGSEYFLDNYPKVEHYPDDIKNKYYEFYMIFQNESYKESFLHEMEIIREKETNGINRTERDKLQGAYFGFPPKATDYFSEKKFKVVGGRPVNIPISYHGLSFASYNETYKEDMKWLIETYNLPLNQEHKSFYMLELDDFKQSI